tara:strand:+ start:1302 stop:1538 length:237 start_codon:yes stop_codon:yes gene_type:complete
MITNNTNQKAEVILKVKENKLNEFKSISLSPDEKKSICIEYEGPITDGIYVEFDNQTDIIELQPQQANEFTLKERKLK